MAEKKKTKKTTTKATKSKKTTKTTKSTSKKTKSKTKKKADDSFADSGIVIVDDDLEIDQEKVNEERKAYLEEARSQEAFD